ncbi:MAG: N-acetylmuramoyl-L-alanine amidase, partial [Verrucomicrobiota bacterium]
MKKIIPLIIVLLVLAGIAGVAWYVKENVPLEKPVEPIVSSPIKHPAREFQVNWATLEAYQNTITEADFRRLLTDVYTVGDTWQEVIKIYPDRAEIATSGETFVLQFLQPGEAPPAGEFPAYWDLDKPLNEMHIAIDPGHIGGDWANVEERNFGKSGDKKVREGDMTLATAKRLKPLLEKLGAKVTLVRKTPEPVTQLRTDHFMKLYKELNPRVPDGLLRASAEKRFYRRAEIVERAKLVNQSIQPDLVLCLHYNAASVGAVWTVDNAPILTDENHFHLLLNGAYTSGEVLDEGDRFQMIERMVQRTHKHEARIGAIIADVFVEHTGLEEYSYDPNSRRAKNVDGHPYL